MRSVEIQFKDKNLGQTEINFQFFNFQHRSAKKKKIMSHIARVILQSNKLLLPEINKRTKKQFYSQTKVK